MRLLILTQKVDKDDSVLGFFHSWIREFAARCEKVIVVCLEKGKHDLPDNVKVFSLGKEKNKIKTRVLYALSFYRHIWGLRKEYDAVFVHMNPEYVALGGFLWRLWRKKIGMWYVHRQVNLKLRIAEKFAHIIFSTTREAFRLKSKKVHFLGHGIDFSLFPRKQNLLTSDVDKFEVVHVGRITPIKNIEILIEAAAILKRTAGKELRIKIVGGPVSTDDRKYERRLKEMIKKLGLGNTISFAGNVPFVQIKELYTEADISVNLTPTGGMDKAVLESIASGTVSLSANKAFKEFFGEYAPVLLYNERDAEDTANKIINIMNMNSQKRREVEDYLYKKARTRFDLNTLIKQVVYEMHCL